MYICIFDLRGASSFMFLNYVALGNQFCGKIPWLSAKALVVVHEWEKM